ncbi:MAG: hypothetical protein PHV02_12115 [Rhodocyclaceae bacterium]|nr:hypothetical protein [Rhodocyclaceae bacterium]
MIKITSLNATPKFTKDIAGVSEEIKTSAANALKLLLTNPQANSLRLHRMSGYKPPLWKIDILPNKSWQIVLEIHGEVATLKRLLTHKEADRL